MFETLQVLHITWKWTTLLSHRVQVPPEDGLGVLEVKVLPENGLGGSKDHPIRMVLDP